MEVYIVIHRATEIIYTNSDDWDDDDNDYEVETDHVEAVFISKDKAEKYIKEHEDECYALDYLFVEEWKVE